MGYFVVAEFLLTSVARSLCNSRASCPDNYSMPIAHDRLPTVVSIPLRRAISCLTDAVIITVLTNFSETTCCRSVDWCFDVLTSDVQLYLGGVLQKWYFSYFRSTNLSSLYTWSWPVFKAFICMTVLTRPRPCWYACVLITETRWRIMCVVWICV